MENLLYKKNLDETIERLTLLYDRKAQDRIFAAFNIPSPTLGKFRQQYKEGFCDYPDPVERSRFWDSLLAERSELLDDSIPCAYLSEIDQGLFGGMFGANLQFMAHPENGWISSMVMPLLKDWSKFDNLKPDPSNLWFERYIEQMYVFAQQGNDKFGVSHFCLINGLNAIFELVGATNTYISVIENPNIIKKAFEFSFSINMKIQNAFFEHIPLVRNGTCSNMSQWIPGRIISESVDPFHMTSPDYFEEWGKPMLQRALDNFDGGVIHVHGNGRHLLKSLCSVKGIRGICLLDDRGWPKAYETVRQIQQDSTKDTPLSLIIPFDKFEEGLQNHTLAGGVIYMVSNTPSVNAANKLMKTVLAYRL